MSGDTWKRRALARWLAGDGVEIGALHNPLHVPRAAAVRYVDRDPTDVLQARYPELGRLVPVSVIGDAQDLSRLATESLDFVIANHLIEHLEDPVRGLVELTRVLRPGGVLYCAVPDCRATFDRHREVTPLGHFVDEYRNGVAASRLDHYREYVALAEERGPLDGPNSSAARARVDELIAAGYPIHFHVFRPDTFLDLLAAAHQEAGLVVEPVAFAACDFGLDDEFIFVLRKVGAANTLPRIPTGGLGYAPRHTPRQLIQRLVADSRRHFRSGKSANSRRCSRREAAAVSC